jgi:HPt (histidine-containing phosphotransfer) domain-containing protein
MADDPLNKRDRNPQNETARAAADMPPSPEPQSSEQKLQSMLSSLWERSRHTVVERAALLQNAGQLWTDNRLDEPTRLRAVDSAHKLAGVLGTFGLPRGTELAREAEVLFGRSRTPSQAEIARLQVLLAELTSLVDGGPLTAPR